MKELGEPPELDEQSEQLLGIYRQLSPLGKAVIRAVARYLHWKDRRERRKRGR